MATLGFLSSTSFGEFSLDLSPAVVESGIFLELEILDVKRTQIHATYHNGEKRLLQNEYELRCRVIKNETGRGPKTGETIRMKADEKPAYRRYDSDGKEITTPMYIDPSPHTFYGNDAKKGARFFAAFSSGTYFDKVAHPAACRKISERDAWGFFIKQYKQTQLFLQALRQTAPDYWKPEPQDNGARLKLEPSYGNPERKVDPRSKKAKRTDPRQKNARWGSLYELTSPKEVSKTAVLNEAIRKQNPDAETLFREQPYTSTFRMLILPNEYSALETLPEDDYTFFRWSGDEETKALRVQLPDSIVYVDWYTKDVFDEYERKKLSPKQKQLVGKRISEEKKVHTAIQEAAKLCNSPKEVEVIPKPSEAG